MEEMQLIVWTLPIIFMFHDFEEIIFMKPWIEKNTTYIEKRFPRLSKKLLPHFSKLSTNAFALMVAEEFILISIITYFSYVNRNYLLWLGIFTAFFLHLIIHILQWIIYRRYIPTIATSFIASIYCIYSIRRIMLLNMFTLREFFIYSSIGVVIITINIALCHCLSPYFDRWLYSAEK